MLDRRGGGGLWYRWRQVSIAMLLPQVSDQAHRREGVCKAFTVVAARAVFPDFGLSEERLEPLDLLPVSARSCSTPSKDSPSSDPRMTCWMVKSSCTSRLRGPAICRVDGRTSRQAAKARASVPALSGDDACRWGATRERDVKRACCEVLGRKQSAAAVTAALWSQLSLCVPQGVIGW